MARRLGTVLLVVVAVALLVIAPTPAVAGTGIRAVLQPDAHQPGAGRATRPATTSTSRS